jgi:hypothetical protein
MISEEVFNAHRRDSQSGCAHFGSSLALALLAGCAREPEPSMGPVAAVDQGDLIAQIRTELEDDYCSRLYTINEIPAGPP